MSFEPKHELPVTAPGQDGPWPNNLQQPIQTRRIIDASQNFFDTTANPDAIGDQVVNYYAASIGNFVATQRRDYASGINPQQNRFLTLPGLAMRYENNQGMERLTLVAQPESFTQGGNQVTDTNLDGYIVWVHSEPFYPNVISQIPAIGGPYDIFLNGYKIYEGFKITQQSSAFVIMFGLTALRCHSLEDKTNPLLKNMSYGPTAYGLSSVNDILPSRADIAASNAPDGAVVPRHLDEPLYPIFNWDDALNCCTLVNIGFESYQRWSSGIPQVVSGVHFKDPKKSPLVEDGPNFITVLTQPGQQSPEILMIDVVFAEFYDRKKTEIVQQSWNYNSSPGQTIIANDKPLYFGCSTQGSPNVATNTGFDLTKGATNSQDDCLLSGLDDALNLSSVTLLGLTAEQQAAITAYGVTCAAIIDAFDASQAPVIASAIAALNSASATRQTDKTTYDNDAATVLTYQAVVAGAQAAYDANPTEGNLLVLESAQASLAMAQATAAMAMMALTAADDALDMAQAAYTTAIDAQPTLPPVPADAGMSIDPFVWRTVDVTGDDWIFGEWTSP